MASFFITKLSDAFHRVKEMTFLSKHFSDQEQEQKHDRKEEESSSEIEHLDHFEVSESVERNQALGAMQLHVHQGRLLQRYQPLPPLQESRRMEISCRSLYK